MTEIVASELNLMAPNGSELVDVSFEWQSPKVVALCSDDTELVETLAAALHNKLKNVEGQLTINGEPVSKLKRQIDDLVWLAGQLQFKPRKHLDKWVQKLVKKDDRALDWDQSAQLFHSFDISTDIKLKDLTDEQARLVQILLPTILGMPIIAIGQEFDQLTATDTTKVWSLLRDYAQKTDALIIMSSSDVTTMLKYADVMYYFDRGHLTSTRQLVTHDSLDCVVTVTGTGFPADTAERVGAHLLEEAANETRFLFSGNIQALLPLLEQSTITDVRIVDATLEDELLAY